MLIKPTDTVQYTYRLSDIKAFLDHNIPRLINFEKDCAKTLGIILCE